ncbi:MAG TPA: hypothetical protein VFM97_02200 [Gammaproteobacteria bacterium]|nr:hypothetical protein [Gammaproteobacteria bacterium]
MRLWTIRIVAVALVGLTALGVIGHAVNVARHSTPDKAGDGSCTVHWSQKPAGNGAINFADVANGKTFTAPVQIECHGVDLSQYSLSFHVYDGHGKVIRFDNPHFPLHDNRGVLKLTAGDLAAYRSQTVVVRPDLVKGDGFWVSRKYHLHASPLTFHLEINNIKQHIAAAIAAGPAPAPGKNCEFAVQNQSGVVRYDYARLDRDPSMAVQVTTTCPALAGKRLTYHVVETDGQLLAWDVMSRKSIKLSRSVNGRQTLAAATFQPTKDAGGRAVWTATLPIDIYRYRFGAPQDLHFIVDVINDDGSLFLHAPSAALQVTVDYDLPRVRKIYQIVPRLIPANSLARVPVVYNFYSPRTKQTGFRLSESFLRKPSLYRSDSRRITLPELQKGNNWHAVWLYADTPPAGIYSVTAGFVYDPYAWYGDIFKIGGTTSLVINPFLFFLCSLAGIWFLFRFCERVVRSPHWYGKLVYALAAALVIYIVVVPTVLTVVGLAAIVTYWFIYKLLHAAPETYGRVLLISGFVFGLVMELYWGAGILGEYWHAVVLSATLQGVLVFLLCLPFRRKRGVCTGIVVSWFVLWLVVYLTFDIYTKFFGQAPKLDILTYAGQGAALTNEIIGLFGGADWGGIGIWCFFPAAVMIGLYRVRALNHARSRVDDSLVGAPDS